MGNSSFFRASSLLILLGTFSASQSAFGNPQSPTVASATPTHKLVTMRFPERSVGRIFYVKSIQGLPITKLENPPLNAKGAVTVPSDQALSVMLNYDGATDSSFFEAAEMHDADIVQVDMHDVESCNDETLKHLAHLQKLRRILFNSTDVTDLGLKYLAPLQNLYGIVGSGSLIKGPGIKYLQSLPNLELLELPRTNLRDCKFETLPPLPHLKSVSLSTCVATDSVCVFLGKLTLLNFIDISKNKITDAGIARLTGLKLILGLNLADTQITQRVVKSLTQFPFLRNLTLTENQLSPDALASLRKALPKCHVEIKPVGAKIDADLFAPLK